MDDLEAAGYGYIQIRLLVIENGAPAGTTDYRKAKRLGEVGSSFDEVNLSGDGVWEELIQLGNGLLGLVRRSWDEVGGTQYGKVEIIDKDRAARWLFDNSVCPPPEFAAVMGLKDFDAPAQSDGTENKAEDAEEAGLSPVVRQKAYIEDGRLWFDAPDPITPPEAGSPCPIRVWTDHNGSRFAAAQPDDKPLAISTNELAVLRHLIEMFPEGATAAAMEAAGLSVGDPGATLRGLKTKHPTLFKHIETPGRGGAKPNAGRPYRITPQAV